MRQLTASSPSSVPLFLINYQTVDSRLAIEERTLGRSDVMVPRIALGCGSFGGIGSAPQFFGAGLDSDQAFAVMDAAWELGITHFDTADAYGGGRSETAIGAWMRSRGVRPLLTTKTFNPMAVGADHGLAPARIERQLHASLERLGVDRVDVFMTHEFDPDVAADEVVATLDRLRAEGLIRATGVSNYDAAQLEATLAAGHVDAVQNSYSLLVRADEAQVMPLCARAGVGYTAYSPLAGGWLTGKYRRGETYPAGSRMTQRPEGYAAFEDDATFDALDVLAARGAERGISMAGVALSWLLAQPGLTALAVGPMRPEHLEPVREALAHPLDDAERDDIGALVR
jgi:aryl-alcohol dehydrogenase-like predicted oxidoreductase